MMVNYWHREKKNDSGSDSSGEEWSEASDKCRSNGSDVIE